MRIAIIEDDEDISNNYADHIHAAWDSWDAEVEIDQLFNEDQARVALERHKNPEEAYDLITLDIDLSGDASGVDKLGGTRILGEMDKNQRATVIVVSAFDSPGLGSFIDALKSLISWRNLIQVQTI